MHVWYIAQPGWIQKKLVRILQNPLGPLLWCKAEDTVLDTTDNVRTHGTHRQ